MGRYPAAAGGNPATAPFTVEDPAPPGGTEPNILVVENTDNGRLSVLATGFHSQFVRLAPRTSGGFTELFLNNELKLTNAALGVAGVPGLLLGADVNLYRGGADTLKTDDHIQAGGQLWARFGLTNQVQLGEFGTVSGLNLGLAGDTNLYRSAANLLRTDDSFEVAGYLWHQGATLGFYNVTPVARAAAIAAPSAPSAVYVQAEAQSMKTAVDAIRTALANIGITS